MSDELKSRITEDRNQAMRSKDKPRLSTLRLLLAAIKQFEIDQQVTLDDQGIIAVIEKMIKQRHDAVRQYTEGQRPELAEKEQSEITVLQAYLPAQLDYSEIIVEIDEAIKQAQATSMRDMGQVMNLLKSRLQGRADMAKVSQHVKEKLS